MSRSTPATSWTNWTGDRRCSPRETLSAGDEDGVVAAVRRARSQGLTLRVAGASHSFSDLVPTAGILLRCDGLNRVVEADRESGLARVQAGITLHELGPALAAHGLALENQGDIDAQTLAGALATGTHGTGARFRNLSANVVGMRLVDGRGEVVELGGGDELRAARVSLGALGVVTELTVRCVPLYGLDRVDEPRPTDATLASLDESAAEFDHFELFAFPHTNVAMVRSTRRVGADVAATPLWRAKVQEELLENAVLGAFCGIGKRFPRAVPALNRTMMRAASRGERRDLAYRVYASHRAVRFTEMEYALPRESGREAVERALALVAERRIPTGFPFEVRFVAGDDALLSPAHGRDTLYLAVHQYRGMPFEDFFAAIEDLLAGYGGRPHWGKRNTLTAEMLAPRYPEWDTFLAVRDRFDPDRVFANAGVRRVLGP
jgi:L-gulonolactone oxidase